MSDVIIGMDPHKHSATIEIIDSRERVLDHGRFATTTAGYRAMLAAGRRYPQRRWAIEGCNGIGRHIAQRLVADGEKVIDVPSKLSAQVRVFATGQGRKTDPIDAHSVAVAALRSTGLREVAADDATVALRLLVDRRDTLGRTRTDLVNRLHVFLLDLIPGGAKKDLSARQARALLSTVEPTDLVGRTRHRLAGELVGEIETIDGKIKAADRQLTQLVKSSGSRVQALHGIGPSGAARLIGDVGDITRFASRGHFAAWKRYRAPGRLVRPAATPPALARGQPSHQPGPAHHGRRPAAPRHRRTPLLRPPPRRGQDLHGGHAGVETPTVRCGLQADDRRRETRRDGPGRTPRERL